VDAYVRVCVFVCGAAVRVWYVGAFVRECVCGWVRVLECVCLCVVQLCVYGMWVRLLESVCVWVSVWVRVLECVCLCVVQLCMYGMWVRLLECVCVWCSCARTCRGGCWGLFLV